ncbi:hypothetical protein EalM132_00033 [Exiguobacterium phage vB_EalM-132]|nr:hypothetical protein EalM132_00033 [Exiguobacterium phage vB_EalM-132]
MFMDKKPPQTGHEYTDWEIIVAKGEFSDQFSMSPNMMVMNHRTLATLMLAHPTVVYQRIIDGVANTNIMGLDVYFHNDYEGDDIYIGYGIREEKVYTASDLEDKILYFYDGNYAFINRNIREITKKYEQVRLRDYKVGRSVYRPNEPVTLELVHGKFIQLTPEGVE